MNINSCLNVPRKVEKQVLKEGALGWLGSGQMWASSGLLGLFLFLK